MGRFSLRQLLWFFVALGGAIASIWAIVEDFHRALKPYPPEAALERRHAMQFALGAVFLLVGWVAARWRRNWLSRPGGEPASSKGDSPTVPFSSPGRPPQRWCPKLGQSPAISRQSLSHIAADTDEPRNTGVYRRSGPFGHDAGCGHAGSASAAFADLR